MATQTVYRGYVLNAMVRDSGWQVFIAAPGSATLAEMPSTSDPRAIEAVMAEARKIVDRELGGRG
jgi:hypothetical protein